MPPFREAPDPIRVGLDTSATVIRLTSSQPFRIGAGSVALESVDVVVEGEHATAAEGVVFRVQVASYPDRGAASEARASLRSELEEDVSLAREEGTGRYALRVGSFSTAQGAEAARAELVRRGFAGAYAVSEPSPGTSLSALVLHPRDRSPVRLPATNLTVLPASSESFLEVDGSPYRGHFELFVNRSQSLTLVNVVGLEEYLRGVVPAELSPDVFPEKEALKAQAIAARTYAVKRMGEYAAEGFDICDTPACQVYRGVGVERELSDEAVRETAGQILTYEGEPVEALYTSTCGGRTEAVENVFSTPTPYLVSRACALERSWPVLSAVNGGARSLEAALLHVAGYPKADTSLTPDGLRELLEATVSRLGQEPCAPSAVTDGRPVDVVLLAKLLSGSLCWDRRADFLMSMPDARRLVSLPGLEDRDRLDLAFAIREGLVRPSGEGIRRGAPLTREDVEGTLFRVVTRYGEPLLREGRVVSFRPDRLDIEVDSNDGDDDEEILSAPLARETFFFREAEPGAGSYYEPSLRLLPNDRVSFHRAPDGIDVLVAHGAGASFDRSSRFSHWTVRRTAADLSAQVSSQEGGVGSVLDLRPKRYGRSGRLAELEIVGSQGTVTVRGLAIRRVLGLRENLFFFDRQTDARGKTTGWVFTGRGWGHGVGLCQVGAYGMAASGYDYRAILQHYYPGTELTGS